MLNTATHDFQVLVKLLSYFRTHWWVFILESVLLWSVAVRKFTKTPPVYESHASILIDSSRRQLYQSVLLPSYVEASNVARKRNIARLLMSQDVADRFRAQITDYFNSEGRPSHLRYLFSDDGTFMMNDLRDYLNLSWDRNSDTYNLKCIAREALAAKDICQSLLTAIESYYPEIGEREALLKRDFLSRQISSLTQQIYERERVLSDLQKNSADFLSFVLSDLDDKALQRMKAEETKLKHEVATNRAIHRLLMESPRATKGEYSVLEVSITALTKQIANLQYQIQLTERAEDEAGRMEKIAALQDEIKGLSAQLQKLNEKEEAAFLKAPFPQKDLRDRLAELELEYQTAAIRLEELEREIQQHNLKQNKYGEKRLEFERMLAELNQRKKLLSNLYQKQQETELELSTGKAEIFTLQPPTYENFRVEPQFSKFFYGTLSFNLFIISLSIALLMLFAPRLDNEEEVSRLNLPVLGKVPVIKRPVAAPEEIAGFGLEYLKIMNYRILRETKELKSPVVVISSPHAREGKSTIARLLAMASNSPGKRTLLIDGDLLTSHPNVFFGIKEDATVGLRSILSDNKDINPSSLVIQTPFPGLSILPRGGRMEPSALPDYLDPMKRAFDMLRRDFDLIYIDTPPLFAANLAHQWTGVADLIVLVARIYVTRPKDLAEAVQTCKIFSRAPVGIALNCTPMTGPDRRVSNYYFSRRKLRATKTAA